MLPSACVLFVAAAFLCGTTSGDPHSPFNRNKVHQDNIQPSGFPQGTAFQNHPSVDQLSLSSKFDVVYQWRIMDFDFPSGEAKQRALATG